MIAENGHRKGAKVALAGLTMALVAGSANAQSACIVTDPTGTPLNVRTEPNGPIVGALHNGAPVHQVDTVADYLGRPWSLVVPIEGGKTGWAFRQFVTCY